jgi:2-phospho-L-lactate/phosphoenolpyruvate guanylyltransferase
LIVRVLAIPVKSLDRSKSRLSPICSPLERAALTLAMLEDVLDASLPVAGWDTWVVSPDEAVLEIAARRGARAVPEETPSLLGAVRQVDRQATERGADALAIVLADVALATSRALSDALHTLGPVVMAPADDELGTNVLIRRPPRAIRPRFGPDSFSRHRQEAESKGLPTAVVRSPELAFDLDAPDEVLSLVRSEAPGKAREVCLELQLEARIHVRT